MRYSHRRLAIALVFATVLVLIVYLRKLVTLDPSASTSVAHVQDRLHEVALDRLRALQLQKFDVAQPKQDWGLEIGNYDLEKYRAELQDVWGRYLGFEGGKKGRLFPWWAPNSRTSSSRIMQEGNHPSPPPILIQPLLEKLNLYHEPSASLEIPHRVYTTSNLPHSQYPKQFDTWHNVDPNLEFTHMNDTELNTYLTTLFPPSAPISRMLATVPRAILKADIFRYVVLLHKGGIYTDVDTALIRPFDEWGTHDVIDYTDHLLESLPILTSINVSSSSHTSSPPSVIVALETDGSLSRKIWQERSFVRGIQIVQWTIASSRSHPIFLDVIGRAVKKWEEAVSKGLTLEDLDPLEWTGPGPFSDAVFRYLLARYGFHPKQASWDAVPIRVGDVLILPEKAFQARGSEGPQQPHAAVWHGFSGSWRAREGLNEGN
jgi:alpha 1,6-mannosyltransferase